jgi:hypothetical protein
LLGGTLDTSVEYAMAYDDRKSAKFEMLLEDTFVSTLMFAHQVKTIFKRTKLISKRVVFENFLRKRTFKKEISEVNYQTKY